MSVASLVTRTVALRRLKNASITHSPYLRPTFAPKSESNRLSDTKRTKCDKRATNLRMRPLIAICSHFCCPGTPLANKKRNIFVVRHTGARATILRMESESYPPSPRIRFFVRFLCALRAPWRLNGEWNTNNFLCLRNTVVFCSPGRPIWRTKYECGALSPRSCFLFATEAPWRTKYKWFPNNSIFLAFFVRQTSAWATILRMESETYPPSAHFRFLFVFCSY